MSDLDRPNNPWAHLNEIERAMDPTARSSLFLERRMNANEKQLEHFELVNDLNPGGAGADDAAGAANPEKARIGFCKKLLASPNATLHGRYELNSAGYVIGYEGVTRGKRIHLDSYSPDLLDALWYEDRPVKPTAETVRQAALAMAKAYPEIHFEFSQSHDTIEYTATIEPSQNEPV